MKNIFARKKGFHKSASLEGTFLVSCRKSPGTISNKRTIEKTQKKQHARLLVQMQPPACQGNPVATTDRSGNKRVS